MASPSFVVKSESGTSETMTELVGTTEDTARRQAAFPQTSGPTRSKAYCRVSPSVQRCTQS
jgi:hypothetical protein